MNTQRTMQQINAEIKATLERAGIPYKEINVYGSQIVVTSLCRNTADKWATVLAKFAKVRGIVETCDYAKVNTNTVLKPSTVRVFRTFAVIQ